MFARDINKYKETKGVDKYRPPRRENQYRQIERYQDRYQPQQKPGDRCRSQDQYNDRYRPNERSDTVIVSLTDDMKIAIVNKNLITIVTHSAKVPGETTKQEKITAMVVTAVIVTKLEKITVKVVSR